MSIYTATHSRGRLALLQSVLKRTSNENLIIIPGVDGKNNVGSQLLTKWLLLGSASNDSFEPNLSLKESIIEDVILVISTTRVSVFYGPDAASIVEHHVNAWPNTVSYTCSRKDFNNTELYEAFKVQSFVKMTEGIENVSFTLTKGWRRHHHDAFGEYFDPESFDKSEIETWPLVQAYALVSMGTGGFFSMNRCINDASKLVAICCADYDSFNVRKVIQEDVPQLLHHWNEMISQLGNVNDASRRLLQSEEDIGESILTYYEFGALSLKGDALREDSFGSRVLLGSRSNLDVASSSSHTVEDTGIEGNPAIHFTAEAEAAHNGLSVARTYFLSLGRVEEDSLFVENEIRLNTDDNYDLFPELKEGGEKGDRDAPLLMRLYALLLKGLNRAVHAVSVGSTLEEVLEAVHEEISDSNVPWVRVSANLRLTVTSKDVCGNTVHDYDNSAFMHSRLMRYVRLQLCHIPSVDHPGKDLGSLLCGDSVLCASLPGRVSLVKEVNLTSSFSLFNAFPASGIEEVKVSSLNASLSDKHIVQSIGLGDPITPSIPRVTMVMGDEIIKTLEGSVRLYQGGLVFFHPCYGPFLLSLKSHLFKLILASDTDSDVLILQQKMNIHPYSALSFIQSTRLVALHLPHHAMIYSEILSAMEEWQNEKTKFNYNVEIEHVSFETSTFNLPARLREVCSNLKSPVQDNETQESVIASFVEADAGRLNARGLSVEPRVGYFQPEKRLPITLVSGLPSPSKDALIKSISLFDSERICWILIDEQNTDLVNIDESHVKSSLIHISNDKDLQSRKEVRVILVVPGFSSTLSMACLVSDSEISHKFYISSSVCVVSSNNFYMDKNQSLVYPYLLHQILNGFVTSIVLANTIPSNSSSEGSDVMKDITRKLNQVNPLALLTLLPEGCNLTDEELSSILDLKSFASAVFIDARKLSFPNWWSSFSSTRSTDLPPSLLLSNYALSLKTIFEKNALLKTLKNLVSYSTSIYGSVSDEIEKNYSQKEEKKSQMEDKKDAKHEIIYIKGSVRFLENPNVKYIVHVSPSSIHLSQPMSLVDGADKDAHFTFIGVGSKSVDRKYLEHSLLECRKKLDEMKTLRERSNLSQEELQMIKTKHITEPLPSGCWFDGTFYLDFNGHQSEFHPKMSEFTTSYIEEQNKMIMDHNDRVERERVEAQRELQGL